MLQNQTTAMRIIIACTICFGLVTAVQAENTEKTLQDAVQHVEQNAIHLCTFIVGQNHNCDEDMGTLRDDVRQGEETFCRQFRVVKQCFRESCWNFRREMEVYFTPYLVMCDKVLAQSSTKQAKSLREHQQEMVNVVESCVSFNNDTSTKECEREKYQLRGNKKETFCPAVTQFHKCIHDKCQNYASQLRQQFEPTVKYCDSVDGCGSTTVSALLFAVSLVLSLGRSQ